MSKPNDKRTVTTDALETLGTIHVTPQKRDAIHLAVEPVEAAEKLWPGDHILVVQGMAARTEPGKGLGIVDPFLLGCIHPGQKFWFVMYPRMVHSLRHVWTHPAFVDEPLSGSSTKASSPTANALTWIEKHADVLGLSYDELMQAAEEWLEHEDYYTQYGSESMRSDFDPAGFWPRYEIVTGKVVAQDKRQSFFSCSC